MVHAKKKIVCVCFFFTNHSFLVLHRETKISICGFWDSVQKLIHVILWQFKRKYATYFQYVFLCVFYNFWVCFQTKDTYTNTQAQMEKKRIPVAVQSSLVTFAYFLTKFVQVPACAWFNVSVALFDFLGVFLCLFNMCEKKQNKQTKKKTYKPQSNCFTKS